MVDWGQAPIFTKNGGLGTDPNHPHFVGLSVSFCMRQFNSSPT